MFKHGFPPQWSTFKKLIWLVGSGIAGAASGIWKTVTGTLIHITDALASPVKELSVAIEPLQSGSGDPSPTNVRPITGWTGCEVTRTGENLLPSEAQDVSNWSAGTTQTGGYKFWKCNLPSGTYYVHSPHEVPYNNSLYMRAVVYDATGGYTRVYMYHPSATDENRNVLGVTIPQGGYLQLERYGNEGDAFTNNLWITISENTPYSAYSGTTLSVTFPDSTGTVYGGTVDLVSGVLTINKIYRHLKDFVWASNNAGGIGWEYYSSTSVTGKKKGATNIISDQFKTVSAYSNVAQYTIRGFSNADYIAINFPAELAQSSVEVTQWLTEHDAVACYELAEPIEIQLTPQEISTLKDVNNVWSNSNGDTTIIYKAQA